MGMRYSTLWDIFFLIFDEYSLVYYYNNFYEERKLSKKKTAKMVYGQILFQI